MDAIKLLGDLLGNQDMSRGMGQQILKTILGGGGDVSRQPQRQYVPPQGAPQRMPQGTPGGNPLGGLIRAAIEEFGGRGSGDPQRGHQHGHQQGHAHQHGQVQPVPSAGSCGGFPDDREEANRQAQMLIRAMVNAAKADGQIDREEQENIVSRMGNLSQDEIQFLRHEFAQPLDVTAFAREVPRGLEDEVYTISLTAIDLDTNPEARYLHELAHALGLSHDQCNHIHAQLGAPRIFA